MQRRSLLSASLGLGALVGLAGVGVITDAHFFSGSKTHQALAGLRLYSSAALAFGTTVSIKVLHDDTQVAQAAVADALQQVQSVDALMSVYQEGSQVYQLNERGVLRDPDPHLLQVLAFSQQLSQRTAGAFDITVQPLWRVFSRAKAKATQPTLEEVAAAKALVNWQQLAFDSQQVLLQREGMAITLNGVAQGYAVDLALDALRRHGVQHALLDTGEFGAIGSKAQGQPWRVGVTHPRQHDSLAATLPMDGRQVATSGDYETFFSPDFSRHHIFDPTTGESPPELASVTVVAPGGMLADGLSTALMVMGAEKALALAAQWHDVDAMLITKQGAILKTLNFPEFRST